MPNIHLTTFIAAPAQRVFDLSRHLAIYRLVFNQRKESFSSGAGGSLMTKGETISIAAKHAGRSRSMMLKMADLQPPLLFIEEQTKGDLQQFRHEHHFKQVANGTIIIDLVTFGPPRDLPGRLLARLYLKQYLENLLHKRNEIIRNYAETEKWRAILP